MKCSQKVSWEGGGQFSCGKINPGKYLVGKLAPGNLPPFPHLTKKKKAKKEN